jgi:LuxR family transcriptional regulator of spore coat protein
MTRPGTGPSTQVDGVQLTPRERAVLAELAEDVTVEEIATRLWVSRNTVKSQLRSAYRKLGVSTRAEAVAWAREAGLS